MFLKATAKGVFVLIKVKMNVQTAYYGELLRKGKVYDIERKTAERWIASKIANKVEESNNNEQKST